MSTPDGKYLYVVNTGDDTVSVVRTSDYTVIATVEVGKSPYGVAVSPSGAWVYVSNTLDNTVSVVRNSDRVVTDTIKVGARPIGIEVSPDGEYLFVAASRDNSVSVISTADRTVISSVDVGNWPWGLAIGPNGDYVYVSNIAEDTITVIRTADTRVTDTVVVGADPYSFGTFIAEISDDITWVNTAASDDLIGLKGKGNVSFIDSISTVDPETITDISGKPGSLPFGLLNFSLAVDSAGDVAEVVVYLSRPARTGDKWYKYDSFHGWQDYSAHSRFSGDKTMVTLEFKDGGYGDADGVANGIIVDPSGLGSPTGSASSGSGGGGGGCFISTAAY